MSDKRPPIRIRFKYNIDTGEIEDFIIDDNSITASEEYHQDIARQITGLLEKNAEIVDAGGVRLSRTVQQETPVVKDSGEKKKDGLQE